MMTNKEIIRELQALPSVVKPGSMYNFVDENTVADIITALQRIDDNCCGAIEDGNKV